MLDTFREGGLGVYMTTIVHLEYISSVRCIYDHQSAPRENSKVILQKLKILPQKYYGKSSKKTKIPINIILSTLEKRRIFAKNRGGIVGTFPIKNTLVNRPKKAQFFFRN